ncbi:ABC transporter permease [Glaciecola sp. KUL10]|uniref:ABC transporter permease n=1 Tax=Glaciecola sp. (strain KUL10) TaxID=2161813 RepID=UPI000D78C341|nr:FtsX-like permease family protein [Glaciecola sp. KUL10]GBL05425.1 permease [Glaciecola sp. KUL10]
MNKHSFQLAWRLFIEDCHNTNQRILQATQVILMMFIVTLSLTSESVQSHLKHNLSNLLGADLVLSNKGALSAADLQQLTENSDDIIFTQSLKTTLTHQEQWQRATIKAVSQDYPLQGELLLSDSIGGEIYVATTSPETGSLWIDTRLAAGLNVKIGDTLTIASSQLTITHILQHEPDRLMEGHNVDMRALIHRDDFNQMGLADDTVTYRYLVNASQEQVNNIINWQESQLPSAQVRHKKGAHPLALFWQRTENLIGLASVILLFMAAIAIYQISNIQIRKEQHFTAVCMSVGATRSEVLFVSVIKWLIHLLFLFPVVMILSNILHFIIVHWLSSALPDLAWALDTQTALFAFAGCSLILAVFQVPVWLALKHATVKQLVLNLPQAPRTIVSLLSALSVLFMVTAVYSDNGLLTTMVLGSMFACVTLIAVISWVSLTVGETLTQKHSGLVPFALFMMKQRLVSKSTQIMGVGLCTFLLLFTLMLMHDLGATMHQYQRQFDGNLLVSQADSQQMDALEEWSASHRGEIRQQKPFVYANVVKVNGQAINDFSSRPSASLATLQQSIRLHWTDKVPANNKLTAGKWWKGKEDNWQQISIEEEVMTDIGLSIGDRLTIVVAQKPIEFTIVASHVYKPGAGSITFWVQMPASAVNFIDAPHYYMASIEINDDSVKHLGKLWQQYPTLRMVSMQEMIARFDATLKLVTQVISGFSILIISLSVIVMIASVLAYEPQERKKNSVIMSFGLPKRTCLSINMIEWAMTGGIASIGAMLGTWLAGVLIYQSQFSLPYEPDFVWLLSTLLLITSAVMVIGVFVSRQTLNSSIRDLLAE